MIEVRYSSVFQDKWQDSRFGRKGRSPKSSIPVHGNNSGTQQNMLRTVTYMWSAI